MDKRRTLLIPLDDTPFSRAVLPSIRRWFGPEDVTITLLRVVPAPVGLTSSPPRPVSNVWMTPMYETAHDVELARHPIYASQAEDSAEAAIATELAADVRRLESLGYDVSVAVAFGEPDDAIAAAATEQRADMVAMATHSRRGLGRFVLGSVAEATLRRLDVPLFLVRPEAEVFAG